MAVIGTFGSFTAARLGIYTSQSAMNLIGNNISNINTKGYTRERLDINSLYNTGAPRYASSYNMNIGYGAIVKQVSQLRDPFLDIRYRNENSMLGAAEATINGLEQITLLLDEVGKGLNEKEDFGVIEAQLEDFVSRLNDLTNLVGQNTYDDLVRGSADTLCKLFNSVAHGLEEVRTNEVGYLEQGVDAVNSCLTQIRDLNEQIRTHEIYGDNALELRDARNVAIDELSKYMKIDVTYSMEKIDQFTEVEKLTITLPGTSDPDVNSKNYGKDIKLIDGIYGTQVGVKKIYRENPDYDPQVKPFILPDGTETEDGTLPGAEKNPAYYPYQYVDKNGDIVLTEDPVIENKENPDYQGAYQRTGYANGTDDWQLADKEAVRNPIYDLPDHPNFKKYTYHYIDEAGNYVDTPGANTKINPFRQGEFLLADGSGYTDDPNQESPKVKMTAVLNPERAKDTYVKDTKPYLNGVTGEPCDTPTTPNQKNDKYAGKYLTADGGSTDSELEADYVYDDKYLLELDPLTDKRGYYLNGGIRGEELKEITKLTDTDTSGALQAIRELLTEEGVFASEVDVTGKQDGMTADEAAYAELCKDPGASEKMGIPYYQKVLDNLAQLFAQTMNEANQIPLDKAEIAYAQGSMVVTDMNDPTITFNGSGFLTADGKSLVTKDGKPLELPDGGNLLQPKDLELAENADAARIAEVKGYLDQLRAQGQLTEEYEYYDGGVLFSNLSSGNDPTGITAANISVAHSWSTGEVHVLRSVEPEYIDPVTGEKDTSTTANDNLGHMITLMGQHMNFLAQGYDDPLTQTDAMSAKPFFKGTFQEMFTNISGTLAHDTEINTALYNNYNLNTLNLDNDRTSVSGVDLNEEAVNIMQYQKSYAAACQLLTTLDSMLDKLINGTL